MSARWARPALLLGLAALVLPAGAGAESIAVPPGNSEADQYFETVPYPTGGRSPDSSKSVEDAVREGRLDASTARALEARGEAGEAVATIVAQTGPPAGGQAAGKGGNGGGLAAAALEAPDEQGLGFLFPLLLVLTAAGALAFAGAQWRRSATR